MMQRSKRILGTPLGTLAAVTALLLGCGKDDKKNQSVKLDGGSVQPAASTALALDSKYGCAIDADCEAGRYCFQETCSFDCKTDRDCNSGATCSTRGQCVVAAATPTVQESISGVTVTTRPEAMYRIEPGKPAVVTIGLSGALPNGELAYTVHRSDQPWDGQVHRAEGVGSVSIELAPGAADPSNSQALQRPVDVTIDSALGSFKLALYPALPTGGDYAGKVTMKTFGNVGLPIGFKIVTQPDGAPLISAEKAWLLLDVDAGSLFSPIEAYEGAPTYVAAELVYNAFVQRWVATYDHEFRLASDSILSADKTGQIGRMMRFEIEPLEGERVVGKLSDRWEGFYDALSPSGVVELVDVVFEGDLDLKRVGIAPTSTELVSSTGLSRANPTLIPLPPLDQCARADLAFAVAPVTVNAVEYRCNLQDVAAFKAATEAEQVGCAIAQAQSALSGNTTGKLIASYVDDTEPNPGGMSFSEFLAKCAKNEGGICAPPQRLLCARQLAAYVSRAQKNESLESPLLVSLYQQTTREAFLGRQLAAFKTDTDTRLEWLKTTDYPAIVTSAVKNKTAELLQSWQSGVLDVHLDVLGGYMDPSGMAVLSRATTDTGVKDTRRQLLMEMAQSWRGTMDALSLATSRWDRLFQDAESRAQKTSYVVTHMFDLYLTAGILTKLSRDSGEGYLAAAFGGGFSDLVQRLDGLAKSFDQLVFARDAEVVVSSSLDPTNTNATKLSELNKAAEAEIKKAGELVSTVLEESREQTLNETQLRNRMSNEIEALRNGLVDMCGLPVGCDLEGFRTDPVCTVRTAPGQCGFLISTNGEYQDATTEQLNISEGGKALLTLRDAALNTQIASAELRAFEKRTSLELATLGAFAADIQMWNGNRLQGLSELADLFNQENLIGVRGLEELRTSLAEKARTRVGQISRMQTNIQKWNSIRVAGANTDFATQMGVSAIRFGSANLRDAGDLAIGMGDALAESISADLTGAGKAAAKAAGLIAGFGLRVGANALNFVGDGVENGLALTQSLREAQLENLEETAELKDAISEAQISRIEEQLTMNDALRADQIGALHQIYDLAREQRAAELAYAKDVDELRQRRTAFQAMLLEKAELELRVQRAALGMQQRLTEYLSVSQKAALEAGRLNDLDMQRTNVNMLVGSPGAIFSSANRLSRAELSLQRAKDKLMDWLVALEYYAVRPFMDQRMQILMAINAHQLEAIHEELAKLEKNCGGVTNTDHKVISIRDDLLRAVFPTEDAATGQVATPGDRFRAIMQQGFLPIDKRVRYKTDASVGTLMRSERGILSGTFNIGLHDFANLAATCNAKVVSIAVQIVGDIGSASPTVTVLYDGTSRLRSCQPNITDYVNLIGPERTNFGEITLLRTPGRAISPVAGVNKWRDGKLSNMSLGGLPLASQYTILIDTTVGENSSLDFSRMEDILLDVTYSYSDVFPEGQCQ